MDKLREENGDLREQMESLNMEKDAEIQRLKEKIYSFKRQHNVGLLIFNNKLNSSFNSNRDARRSGFPGFESRVKGLKSLKGYWLDTNLSFRDTQESENNSVPFILVV